MCSTISIITDLLIFFKYSFSRGTSDNDAPFSGVMRKASSSPWVIIGYSRVYAWGLPPIFFIISLANNSTFSCANTYFSILNYNNLLI